MLTEREQLIKLTEFVSNSENRPKDFPIYKYPGAYSIDIAIALISSIPKREKFSFNAGIVMGFLIGVLFVFDSILFFI